MMNKQTFVTEQIASKLWNERFAELKANYKEYEKTPAAIESKRKLSELADKLLDDLFADPENIKKLDDMAKNNPIHSLS